MKKILIALILISLVSTFGLFASGQKEVVSENEILTPKETEVNTLYGAMAVENIDNFTLEEMLKYSIEDERMALAEYELIMKEFDISKPFSNIIEAEKTHEGLLLELYKTYNFEVPTFLGSEHVIIPATLKDTFDVGIEAEIKNIAMYEKFLSYDLNEDVREVFIKLRDGSVSHLEAFRKQAEKY